jgi:hypothetical protein
MNIAYQLINEFFKTIGNARLIEYKEFFKTHPYFAIDHRLTYEGEDNSVFDCIIFLKEKEDVFFNEKEEMYQIRKESKNRNPRMRSITPHKEVEIGIYESKYIVLPETYQYTYSHFNKLKVISSSNIPSNILNSLTEYLTFDENEVKATINSDNNLFIIERIYEKTDSDYKHGYLVDRVKFKNEIAMYMTSDGRYLYEKTDHIVNKKVFLEMITYFEDTYNNRKIEINSDDEKRIFNDFKIDFLDFLDDASS